MATFVLVHGAFRGGWSWGPVRQRLQALGHDIRTPSLTGMGDRAHLRPMLSGEIPLQVWVDDIVSLLHDDDLRDVVLVGHSQAGLVIGPAARTAGDRVIAIPYLDAPAPRPGERGVDIGPTGPPDDDLLPPADTWIPPTPVSDRGAGGDRDLDAATASWMNERLCATPLGPSLEPSPVDAAVQPAHFAFCSRTPPGFPAQVCRHRLDEQGTGYTVLDAGHDAPVTRPDLVVQWLQTIVEPGAP